eukprot:5965178-Pyramimonas_sp.AAC.1
MFPLVLKARTPCKKQSPVVAPDRRRPSPRRVPKRIPECTGRTATVTPAVVTRGQWSHSRCPQTTTMTWPK